MKHTWLYITILLPLASCMHHAETEQNLISFTRKDFKETATLSHDKKINLEAVLYVFFKKGTSYRAYLAYTLTPKHVYLVYEGTNGTTYKTNDLKPVEIFKLDWEGHLLSRFQLDKHAFAITVDSQENFLYACCYDSYEGEVELLRYNLSQAGL